MSVILAHINAETPVTLNALCKATGLTMTKLAMELVAVGGKVTVKDDGIMLAPEPVKEVKPRGPTAKVAPRLDAAREAILTMAATGTCALDVLKAAVNDSYLYTDIMLVSKELLAAGKIVETKKGRKAFWALPAAE